MGRGEPLLGGSPLPIFIGDGHLQEDRDLGVLASQLFRGSGELRLIIVPKNGNIEFYDSGV